MSRMVRGNTSRKETFITWITTLIILVSLFPGILIAATPSPYTIRLVSGEFTPAEDTQGIIEINHRIDELGTTHAIVQFYDLPDHQDRASLTQAGITLLDYLPDHAWLVALDKTISTLKARELGIRWASTLRIIDKLHPRILRGEFESWTNYEDGKVIIVVRLFADVPPSEGEKLAALYEAVTGDYIPTLNTWVMAIDPILIDKLASEDVVQWIDVLPPPLTQMNDVARQVVGANTVQAPPYNLNGSGIVVCVYDGGMVDATHNDFAGRITLCETGATANHATHVAGSVGGSGANSAGLYRGMAPACNLLSYYYEACTPYCLYNTPQDIAGNYQTAMNTYGARLATNSIGSNIAANGYDCAWEGDYETTSQLVDNIVRGSLGAPFIVVFAAGNERGNGRCGTTFATLGVPACAKNIISVGATDDYDVITYFSSWGPTDDGRIKPEVCAPGYNIYSTLPGNTYGSMSGTSMATPITSGCIALVLQQYALSFPGMSNPLPSTIKAILINTAVDLGNVGPDYKYGFGRVDVQAAVDAVINRQFLEDALSTGQSDSHFFTVNAGTPSLRVSLAWADPAATPNANPTLVNDLNLTLTSPSRTIYYPYILNPSSPDNPATTGVDHTNNYEQIVIANPPPGQWTITVTSTSLPIGPQTYSLTANVTLGHGIGYVQGHVTAQGSGSPLEAQVIVIGGSQQIIADSTGFYNIGVVGDSTYTLQASHFGYNSSQQSIYIPADSTVTLNFNLTLAPTGLLEGNIYDVVANTITGAEISVVGTPIESVFSGANGYYRITDIPGGSNYTIVVSKTGYEDNTSVIFIPSGSTVYQNFVLYPIVYISDYESGNQWTQDPSHTATSGQWVAVDPNPTEYQNGDDTTPDPGIIALVTGQNSSVGVDDIDNGISATRSPVIDLSYLSSARLIMNWFFGQRDPGDDAGDFFRIDVSNNGGSTYPVNLLTIGDITYNPDWHTLSVRLDSVITLTSQMRIRVQAADGVTATDIVEGGIDDVKIIALSLGNDLVPPNITIQHLSPSSDPVGPYIISATINDLSGITSATVFYGNNRISFNSATMDNGGSGNLYHGDVPGYPVGTTVYYFVRAVDASPNTNVGFSDTLSFQVLPGGSLVYLLYEDFESGPQGFTKTGIDWEWGIPTTGPGTAHSGTHLWATKLADDYSDNSDSRLNSPTVSLVGIENPILIYWQWYSFEYSDNTFWDGGNLKISSDGGAFQLVTPLGGYDGIISNTANVLYNEPVYGRTDLGNFWHADTVDLSAYSGHQVQVRFHFGSDSYTTETGWYLDDVAILGNLPYPPPEITDVVATCQGNDLVLSWTDPGNNNGFSIYRSTNPLFVPTPSDSLASVSSPSYIDVNVIPSANHYYYRVTVLSGTDMLQANPNQLLPLSNTR